VFTIVDKVFRIVPDVLREQGKAKSVPNVDAGSGALLYHFGMKEFSYYTVLFSVSRAMGMCSQLIVNRAIALLSNGRNRYHQVDQETGAQQA